MKIKNKYPPNIDKIREKFPNLPSGVVFTYGEVIYAPFGKVTSDLRVHEKTHTKQQGDDPDGWWDKYLADEKFRLKQEAEAYRNQYRFYRETCKVKSRIRPFLEKIANDLSGKIYGNIISFDEAIRLIQ